MTKRVTVVAQGEREIVVTRTFDAPNNLVFDALTKPVLIPRWMLGPPGWEMPVCTFDARVGGAYRFEWHQPSTGHRMGLGGVVRELVPGERLVVTEAFDEPWYPGDAIITYTLTGRTTLTMTMLYASTEARDGVLASPMEQGLGPSYDRLEEVLSSL